MYTTNQFEAALLTLNVEIEGMQRNMQEKHVSYAHGSIDGLRCQWNVAGECYSMILKRIPKYDLKFE